ncbi:uncharacterized protein N7479_010590 [Penicillium vulpinum]|uniref:Uncharacterized protein n=1 Tax=Penicillium vulpinum TaxID=29845 RepID=A0A1V6S976_9EURO|nr:uncharacterized protein N7479_010590 [Penicillium vulpinum]KAJ5952177.1 hypothetical protein N7479_010590 [Penicillium vulpinum]OQE10426.1 hypothetical protein PENVUL_c004G01292 [Penicillium vulpinum]
MTSRFAEALADDELVDVNMDEVAYVSFVGSSLKAIGTQNLNSCMAVMMASTKGAVLAHIAPRSGFTNDPDDSINHTRNMMGTFLQKCHQVFSIAEIKHSVLVYAKFDGQIAMPDQRDFIHSVFLENLENNQFPREYSYTVRVGGHSSPGMGTIFIDGRNGPPKLYVEDVEKQLLGP